MNRACQSAIRENTHLLGDANSITLKVPVNQNKMENRKLMKWITYRL